MARRRCGSPSCSVNSVFSEARLSAGRFVSPQRRVRLSRRLLRVGYLERLADSLNQNDRLDAKATRAAPPGEGAMSGGARGDCSSGRPWARSCSNSIARPCDRPPRPQRAPPGGRLCGRQAARAFVRPTARPTILPNDRPPDKPTGEATDQPTERPFDRTTTTQTQHDPERPTVRQYDNHPIVVPLGGCWFHPAASCRA